MSARSLRAAWRAARALHPGVPARVSVALVGDPTMAELHRRFLGDPRTTDVLSFDLRGAAEIEGAFDAEIAIGVEVARREAARRREPLQRVANLYLIHGLLHLIGFDDHAPRERARMRRAERRVLRALAIPSGAARSPASRRSRGR